LKKKQRESKNSLYEYRYFNYSTEIYRYRPIISCQSVQLSAYRLSRSVYNTVLVLSRLKVNQQEAQLSLEWAVGRPYRIRPKSSVWLPITERKQLLRGDTVPSMLC